MYIVHDDPQGPEVTLLIVANPNLLIIIIIINQKSLDNLRSHILQASYRCQQVWCRNINICWRAEVKITELDRARRMTVDTEDIVRF